jgi:hypothetical protein
MKKYRLLAVVLFVSTLTFPAMHASANTYTTNFPLTENPISENGNWINGGKTGLDWQNIETTPGLAFGDWVSGSYNDPVAALTGTWGTNQTATGKVVCISSCPSAGHIQEVEVHLRTSISAHKITGYEFDFWVSPGSNQEMAIVRWNGPINNFTYIARCTSGCAVLHNGDVLTATAIGSTLSAYINGVQVMQAVDRTFSGGSPGIGTDNAIAANNSSFGFSSFTATDQPPSSLLLNPGFESGLVDWANWSNGGTASAVKNAASAHSGNYYAATVPVFFEEGYYENGTSANGGNAMGNTVTAEMLRRQEWWAALAGASGEIYGNMNIWPFPRNWQDELGSIGLTQFGYLASLMKGVAWYRLVPDQSHTIATAGYGTANTGAGDKACIIDNDYVTTAYFADRSGSVSYTPVNTTLTVAMSQFSGPVNAKWFDPTKGSYTMIPGSPFSNSGEKKFVTPGKNSSGDSDWVLLIELAGSGT